MVGLPLLVDQFDNMLRVTERGAGEYLDITNITEDELHLTLQRYFLIHFD
jgi:glucuronosyltransferase